MRRRKFIALLGCSAGWPLVARALQRDRGRHIGVIMNYAESDPEGQKRFSAPQEHLQKLGWVMDGKLGIEVAGLPATPSRCTPTPASL